MAKLEATRRTGTGSRAARRLREQGLVPGIIYGHKQDPEPVSVVEHDMGLVIQHGERMLELDIEGRTQSVLLKDVQWDIYGHHLVHVDFARVDLDEQIEVTIPLVTRGHPTDPTGVVHQSMAELLVRCRAGSIPEEILVPLADLTFEAPILVSDLDLPQGVVPVEDPQTPVVSLTFVAEEEVAEEAEAPAEPELVGREGQEEESE